jgi:hypothetical protein
MTESVSFGSQMPQAINFHPVNLLLNFVAARQTLYMTPAAYNTSIIMLNFTNLFSHRLCKNKHAENLELTKKKKNRFVAAA